MRISSRQSIVGWCADRVDPRSLLSLLFISYFGFFLSACSGAGGFPEGSLVPDKPIASEDRRSVDFISGEVVTSLSGFQAMGVLGEISEKKTSSNGYVMEGAFYE